MYVSGDIHQWLAEGASVPLKCREKERERKKRPDWRVVEALGKKRSVSPTLQWVPAVASKKNRLHTYRKHKLYK